MKPLIIFASSYALSIGWFLYSGNGIVLSCVLGLCVAYLPLYLNGSEKKDGMVWPYFQNLSIWKRLAEYNSGKVNVEKKLDNKQQYIFCNFPHGACTIHKIIE
jgi:hypothetical protein